MKTVSVHLKKLKTLRMMHVKTTKSVHGDRLKDPKIIENLRFTESNVYFSTKLMKYNLALNLIPYPSNCDFVISDMENGPAFIRIYNDSNDKSS